MESQEFLAYVNNPSAVGAESLKQVEELLQRYPFCQTAHLLYALNLYSEEHPNYPMQLKRAAAYAADRRQLKRLIDMYRLAHPKSVTPPAKPAMPVRPALAPRQVAPPMPVDPARPFVPQKPVVPPPLSSPDKPSLPDGQIQATPVRPAPPLQPYKRAASPSLPVISSPSRISFRPVVPGNDDPEKGEELREKLLEIVHRRLSEIAEQHGFSQPDDQPYEKEEPPVRIPLKRPVTFSVQPHQPKTKEELIDRFIREEPRISSPRTVLLKPMTQVHRDPQEEEEIVSETLAILYFKQGNTAKSVRVYEKLCLLFPEKSSYFAARIEELIEKQQSDNEETIP